MQNLSCRVNLLLLFSLNITVIRDLSNKTFSVSCGFFLSHSTVSLYLAFSSLFSQVGHYRVLPIPISSEPPLPAGICIYPGLVNCCISFPSIRHCLTWLHTQLTKQVRTFPSVKRLRQLVAPFPTHQLRYTLQINTYGK